MDRAGVIYSELSGISASTLFPRLQRIIQQRYITLLTRLLIPLFCVKYQASAIIARTDHNLSITSQCRTVDEFLVTLVLPHESAGSRIPRSEGMICRGRNNEVRFCWVHQQARDGILWIKVTTKSKIRDATT